MDETFYAQLLMGVIIFVVFFLQANGRMEDPSARKHKLLKEPEKKEKNVYNEKKEDAQQDLEQKTENIQKDSLLPKIKQQGK